MPGLVKGLWLKEGPTGAPGRSVDSIARTSGTGAPGTDDTYTVAFSDGTSSTFTIHNGSNGMNGTNGTNGRGITSVALTSGTGAAGTTDTYTITFSDGTTSTFTVVNGANGTNGSTGATGRGITSVARTSGTGAAGSTDTYTITYSDATTSTFTVVNGANGTGSGDVTGPASSTADRVATFNGTSGKIIKDSGVILGTAATKDTGTASGNVPVLDGTGKLDSAVIPATSNVLRGVKTADTIRASTTTVSNDPHLTVTIPSTGTYRLRLFLRYAGNTTADMQWGLAIPASSTARALYLAGPNTAANVAQTNTWVDLAAVVVTFMTSSTEGGALLEGELIAGATGSVTVQWAQNTSNAGDTTMKLGSYIELEKIA